MSRTKKSVLFIYSRISGYAGQQAATDLLVEKLTDSGYSIRSAVTWAYDRDKWGKWAYPFLMCQYLLAWSKAIVLGCQSSVVCLNLGQTRLAFMREGLPFRAIAFLRPSSHRIVSLHGSVFMGWQANDPITKEFLRVLNRAHVVTVLGPKQRQCLINLGVSAERVEILCNTSDAPQLSLEEVVRKFEEIGLDKPIGMLFLSNLIISKGYLVYLQALRELSQRSDLPKISAVLCGPLKLSEFSHNHDSAQDAREKIERLIGEIQQTGRVEVEWIEGARGDAKYELYRQAHMFVFPSQYPVEAQPLVLLEAMASGCAVVTSKVGEIPFTMADVGVLVDEVTDVSVAQAISKLACNTQALAEQAMLGQRHYAEKFAVPAHLKRWEMLIQGETN